MSNQVGAQWQAGDVILDLYRVIGILGQDGFGEIYRVRHLGWNVDLAVKSPKPEIVATLGIDRFERDAEAWVNLGLHPHIVGCYYVRRVNDNSLVFTEYLPGGNLRDWIYDRRLYASGTTLALRRILDIAIQFAWGLHYAHEQGVIHQDVKPENALMTPNGVVKVTDFGLVNAQAIATVLHGASSQPGTTNTTLIAPNTGAITPAYCSPEQVNRAVLTRRSDAWGWGLSVLEMFAGGRNWSSGTQAAQALEQYLQASPNSQLPPMPESVSHLLRRCFAPNPDDRPHTLRDIANELQQSYQTLTGEPYPRQEPPITNNSADSLNNRAVSMWDLGNHDDAIRLWEQALTAQPQHQEALYNQSLVLWRSGRIGNDLALLGQLSVNRSHAKDWNIDYLLSLIHLERGDFQTALKLLESIHDAGIHQEDLERMLAIARERAAYAKRLLPDSANQHYPHADVTSVALSADGRYALSGGADKVVKLWDVATSRSLYTFRGHKDRVSAVAFSPNGSYILSGSWDKTIKLCEMVTTTYLHTFKGHRGAVQCLAFSPDGRYFVSGSDDRTIRLWEVATGKNLRTHKGHRGTIQSVAYSPDGRYFLSVSEDKTVKLWEVASGRCLRTIDRHASPALSVAYSPDGRYFLTAENPLQLWDLATCTPVRSFEGHQHWVRSVLFSPDGRYILSASEDKTVKLWEVASGRCLRTLDGHRYPISAMAMSADGCYAMSADAEGLKLWAINCAALPFYSPLRLSQANTTEAVLSSDLVYKQELLQAQTAQEQGDIVGAVRHIRMARSQPGYSRASEAISAWLNLYTALPRNGFNGGWESAMFERHMEAVRAVAFSPDHRYALSASNDLTVKLWDVATNRCVRSLEGHRDWVNSVAFSPDGAYALSGSTDKTLKLWGVSTGSCVSTFRGHADAVYSVAFSPDNLYALSGSADKTLRLWDATTGRCLRTFEGHWGGINAIAFSPDGVQGLSGSQDNTLKLWVIATGECVQTFTGHLAAINSVALSLDGRYALSGSDDKTLRLWDIATGECLRTLAGHTASVRSISFTADGRYALSGSDDKTLRLWDVVTGSCLRTFEGHTASVRSVSFTADGRYALSGSDDRSLRLWTLDWELADKSPANWDEGAKVYLETFLRLHVPNVGMMPRNREPNEQEITLALTRQGVPTWTEADFVNLIHTLGCAGYGWVRQDGIRQQLQVMAGAFAQPTVHQSGSSYQPGYHPEHQPSYQLGYQAAHHLGHESRHGAGEPVSETVGATAFATAFGTDYETAFPTAFVEPPPSVKVILTVTEGSLKGQEFEFGDRTTCIIGRAKDCNLQLPNDEYHKTISRYHCLLDINPPAIRIRDLGSLHGTYVNGQIIGRRQPNQTPEQFAQTNFPEHDLTTGDEIKLGKTVFNVRIEGAISTNSSDETSMATSIVAPPGQTALVDHDSAAFLVPVNGSKVQDIPVLDGYSIVKQLGRERYGESYLARHHHSDALITLKVMRPKTSVRTPVVEAFLQEVATTKALQHPYIIQLLDSGYSNEQFFFLQEYFDGMNAAELVRQRGGRVAIDEAATIILQVLEGLEYAHTVDAPSLNAINGMFSRKRGLVHRDLKPSNILITTIQGSQIAKIADYGIARAFDQAGLGGLSVSDAGADAPLFMPRQRAVDFKYAQPEVDIWASAACLYYLLTGTYPRDFSGKDPYLALLQNEPVPIRQRNPEIPRPLAEVVDIALIDNPEIRFKNIAVFKQTLQGVV